jgi:HEAT repeat protein
MQGFASLDDAISFLKAHMHEDWGHANSPDAAGYLGKSDDEKAFLPLMDALRSGGAYYRATAAIGLGYLGKQDAIPTLIQTFLKDTNVLVRCDAALALGMLQAEEGLPTLLRRFPEEDFEVRKRIVMAVAMFDPIQAEQALAAIENMLGTTPSTNGSSEEFLQYLVQQGRQRQ